MQPINMGNQFGFRSPATEVEAEHLVRPLGRGSVHPQTDQQTRDTGCLDLETDSMHALAQHMPAAQDTFDPAAKQLDVIVTSHKIRMVLPSRVAILQRTRPPRP